MIWKTFFISFILQNKKFTRLLILDATSTNLAPEKIPKRQRSNSEDLDNSTENFNTNKNTTSKLSTIFNKSGYDNRYNDTNINNDVMFNINKWNKQLKLLKKLENKNISNIVKLDLIDEYKKELPSPIIPNIYAGGLFNEWHNEMDK